MVDQAVPEVLGLINLTATFLTPFPALKPIFNMPYKGADNLTALQNGYAGNRG